MFQVKAWTGGLSGLMIVLMLASTATAAADPLATPDDAAETVGITEAWIDGRIDGAKSTADEQTADSPGDEASQSEESAEESDGTGSATAWLDHRISKAEQTAAAVADTASTTIIQLGKDAETTVASGQHMIGSMVSLPADDDGNAEPTAAQATEESTMSRAMVVAATVVAAAAAGSLFAMFWAAGSTAGSAGSAVAAKSTAGLKKVAPIFSPLFTRFDSKQVLEHPNRAQLYTLVAANPGVRLQDLCEEANLSRTAVTHHLRLLENQHLIVSERVGRSRHYYENGGRYERQKKDAYAILQNDRSKDIAKFIMDNPGTIQKALCESLDVRASIAHWHVKRLEEASLVEAVRRGRTVTYFPAGSLSRLQF